MNNRTARKLDALDRRLDAIAARTRLDATLAADRIRRLEVKADVYRLEQLDLLADHRLALLELRNRLDMLEGAATPLCAPESDADAVEVQREPRNGTGRNRPLPPPPGPRLPNPGARDEQGTPPTGIDGSPWRSSPDGVRAYHVEWKPVKA